MLKFPNILVFKKISNCLCYNYEYKVRRRKFIAIID